MAADKPVPSFETLLEQFKACPCGATAFSKATQMFINYPEETKALIPKIKSEELNLDRNPATAAGLWEHAAVLATAKYLHEQSTIKDVKGKIPDVAMADVTYEDVKAQNLGTNSAQALYDRMKSGDRTCGI